MCSDEATSLDKKVRKELATTRQYLDQLQRGTTSVTGQSTPWVANIPPPPGTKAPPIPLRTAVVAGMNSVLNDDIWTTLELSFEVEDDGSVTLSARLDAESNILPSHENIRSEAAIAQARSWAACDGLS